MPGSLAVKGEKGKKRSCAMQGRADENQRPHKGGSRGKGQRGAKGPREKKRGAGALHNTGGAEE